MATNIQNISYMININQRGQPQHIEIIHVLAWFCCCGSNVYDNAMLDVDT
jgi:hypothetical protein